MLSSDCKGCKYCLWMVGLGVGIRCTHDENQQYKKDDDRLKHLPVIISNIPDGCEYKTTSKEK